MIVFGNVAEVSPTFQTSTVAYLSKGYFQDNRPSTDFAFESMILIKVK